MTAKNKLLEVALEREEGGGRNFKRPELGPGIRNSDRKAGLGTEPTDRWRVSLPCRKVTDCHASRVSVHSGDSVGKQI